jgi:hypothetical protein
MCVVSIHPLYQNHHQQDGTKHTTIQKLIIWAFSSGDLGF